MIRYRYDFENATVVAVECERRGYPHRDADGNEQCINTHYDTEADAWRKLISECEASICLGARERAHVREHLEKITKDLADDAERLVKAKAGLEKVSKEAT